jgi:hypothetical protein
VTEDDIESWQICGAMTNIIFRCHNLVTSQFVLVRIFGSSDALFSREDEQRIFRQVAEAKLGPKLLVRWPLHLLPAACITAWRPNTA